MSLTISVSCVPQVTPAELFAAAGYPELRCREELDGDSDWPQGVVFLYLPGVSCRALEVTCSDDSFEVRFLAFSSAEDYRCGLKLLQAVATADASFSVEGIDGQVAAGNLATVCDETWIGEAVSSSMMMLNLVRTMKHTVTVNGPIRSFRIGPELLAELAAPAGDDGGSRGRGLVSALRRLFGGRKSDHETTEQQPLPPQDVVYEQLRRSQWEVPEHCFEASVMRIVPNGSDTERTLSTVGPGVEYLIQKVDFISLMDDDGNLLFLPWSTAPQAFGKRLRRVDEETVHIQAVKEQDWSDLIAKIRGLCTPLC